MPSDIFRAGSTARLSETGVLDRCEAVPKLVGNAQDFLIIAGLAGTAKMWRISVNPMPTTMPVLGSWVAPRRWALGSPWRSPPDVCW